MIFTTVEIDFTAVEIAFTTLEIDLFTILEIDFYHLGNLFLPFTFLCCGNSFNQSNGDTKGIEYVQEVECMRVHFTAEGPGLCSRLGPLCQEMLQGGECWILLLIGT